MNTTDILFAQGNRILDQNHLEVAVITGQDEDNSDAVRLAAAPQLQARLQDLIDILDSTGVVYFDDEVVNVARSLLGDLPRQS